MGSQASGARRRGRNEGSIYKDKSKGRWYAAVSVGFAPDGKTWLRDKVSGATRAEVAEKLENLQAEYDAGVQPDHAYTVQRAVDDWLAEGLDGRSDGTVTLNRHVLKPVTALIGGVELRALTAQDVRRALVRLAAGSSTRTVTIAHNALTRVIRHAEANRYVVHNVAALVDTPKGQPGRPSKALGADHAAAVLKASQESRLGAYVVVCLMTGIRTEEARALRWDHVNMDAASIAVWRSVRLGSDTKTTKSRRTLGMPQAVVESLREHRVRQDEEKLAAAELWLDHDLVFTTAVGTALDAANVRRSFRGICKAAGIGQAWTPRELRTSFVSLLSASACRWMRSPGWPDIRVRVQQKRSTGKNFARSWSRGPRSWTRPSRPRPAGPIGRPGRGPHRLRTGSRAWRDGWTGSRGDPGRNGDRSRRAARRRA